MEKEIQNLSAIRAEIEYVVESAPNRKKEWAAPEFRKVDIQEITRHGDSLSADGMTSS